MTTPAEANAACASYIDALTALDRARLDANISIKPTQLGLDFDEALALSLTEKVAAAGAAFGRTVEIDMESSAYTDRTVAILEAAHRRCGNLGMAVQAYMRRSFADLQRLAALGNDGRPLKIRLVKGAYLEPVGIAFQKKAEVDANYRKLLEFLLPEKPGPFFVAVATHDPTLVKYAAERLRGFGYRREQYEFQMIYGIRRDLQQQVVAAGHTLRVYVPFGTAWCPYFMRRISERPANLWFVVRSLFAEHKSPR